MINARRADRLIVPDTSVPSDFFIGGEFHITKDPGEDWGYNSSFTLDEIERMLVLEYLAVGTEFKLDPSEIATHRVAKELDSYILELIVPGEKKRVVLRFYPPAYWVKVKRQRKRLCQHLTIA